MDNDEKAIMFEFLATRFSPDALMPELDSQQQARFKEFFKEIGYRQIALAVMVEYLPEHTVGHVLSYAETTSERLKKPGALIGPTYLNGQYYPKAASVWVP